MAEPLKEDVDFLEHHGVKGMRWGVRSPESRRRLGGSGSSRRMKKRSEKSSARRKSKSLSNEQLKEAISRMELEKKYVDLSKGTSGAGKRYTSDLLSNSGKTAVGAVVGGVTGHYVKKALTK